MRQQAGQIAATEASLTPYVPRVVLEWCADDPGRSSLEIDGSLVFADVAGFTPLSEKLARKGKSGAEELADAIGSTFSALLEVAYDHGGGLIKFGGDALLLLFTGSGHARRAAAAAWHMRDRLRSWEPSSAGSPIRLRMSAGVHSGRLHLFLVGRSHRELLVVGMGASEVVAMEKEAGTGEIVLSPSTIERLEPTCIGAPRERGSLLRRLPVIPFQKQIGQITVGPSLDVAACIPTAIREHLFEGEAEAEHRMVTIAFVRFNGTDELVEGGPEAAASIFGKLVTRVQEAADHHEVSFLATDVDKDGGKIILAAGAPRATGDDEGRMLLALRDIADADIGLPLQIGVNRARVFSGDIGPHYRRTYTVMGDGVNLAARLMAAAAPGQIVATPDVTRESSTAFETRALEPLRVKGKKNPIEAVEIGAVAADQRHARDVLPLVGRDAEIATLKSLVADAEDGRGAVVKIVGDAGIGKSRLVNEVRDAVMTATVLEAASDLYGSSVPHHPIKELLLDALDIRGMGSEAIAGRISKLVAQQPELAPWAPLLGIPLDVELAPTPEAIALSDAARGRRTAETVRDALAALVDGPAVLIFEDVHWMDEASRTVLRELASATAEQSWLVVISTRPTERDLDLSTAPLTTIAPEPIAVESAVALLEAVTEDEPLPPHRLQAAAERAGGNPLFLMALLEDMRSGSGGEDLPETPERVLTARLDRLSRPQRQLLRDAAVLGASFPLELLQKLAPSTPPVGHRRWAELDAFISLDPETNRVRFRHQLIRDVAYEGLSFKRRREVHAQVAELIVGSEGEVEEGAEMLALHYFHGQRYAEAWRFSRIAGGRAAAKYANAEAVTFYEQALRCVRGVPSLPPTEIASVHESLGDAHASLGDFHDANRAYANARQLLKGEPIATARLLLKHSRMSERVGRYSDAIRWIQRGYKALEGQSGIDALRQSAELSVVSAVMRQAQGKQREAIRWCERAIDEAERSGAREVLAHAYFILDWALVTLGKSEGNKHSWMALAIFEEIGDLKGQAVTLNNLGAYAYFQGKWQEAIELYERGREARERMGDPVNAAYGTSNVGEILSDQGHLEEAEQRMRRALRVWRAAGDRSGVAFAQSQLGRIAARGGKFTEALQLLEEAATGFMGIGEKAAVVDTNARIAETLVLSGSPERAHAVAAEALELATAMGGLPVQAPLIHRTLGYARLQLGLVEDARRSFEESRDVAVKTEADYEIALSMRALWQLAAHEGAPDMGLETEAQATFDRLGVVRLAPIPGCRELPALGASPEVAAAS